VAENLIFTNKEFTFLRELVKADVKFLVVGLAAATLQGAAVVTQDIDLWFDDLNDPGIKKALKKVGGAFVPSFGHNAPGFAGDAVDLFDLVTSMSGLPKFDKEYKNAVEVDLNGVLVKILPLERIIVSKKAANRKKDKAVLPVLENALLAVKAKR